MSWTAYSSQLSTRSFEPTAADRALKVTQQKKSIKELWLLITAVIGFLFVIRILRLIVTSLFSRYTLSTPDTAVSTEKAEKSYPEAVTPGRTGKASWRRLPATLASAFRVVAFRIQVPIGIGAASFAELFFICAYIATMLSLTLTNSENLDHWFFEDRAAHLASCQLPFIVALAGKNNIISWVTGIGHEKLNILHRAAARTCLILLWTHALCRSISGLPQVFDFTHAWMRWGVVGLTAFTLATILSVRFIRNAFFEFFLLSHILLVGIFIIGGYLHAREVEYGYYFWPALVVWAFDRVLRTARLIWTNRGKGGTVHEHGSAIVELVSSDTIRLTLRRKMNWRAGQHAYVLLPTVSDLPTEAHPFTIASVPRALDGSDGHSEKEIVFLVRGRSGFTGRLREYAARNGTCRVPAFVDGPYGCPPDLKNYSTCILIAGGSGVSYTLPLLLDIVHNARKGTSSVRRVIFVWAVRSSEHLEWISKTLCEALAAAQATKLVIEPTVYVTSAETAIPEIPRTASSAYASSDAASASTPASEIGNVDKELPMYSSLKVINGRPSIRRLLQEGIDGSTGPVSVDVSGPTSLTSSVSRALSAELTGPSQVLKGAPPVTLHVETFGMSR
ncbi:ferric reductase NAD binding domain-containing protein [Fomes fomentarius]|nr:ferric reductase NAD binding domain-containing protein [Fomes fomentarius]